MMNDQSRRRLPGLDTEITLTEELGPDHLLTRSVCCYRLLRRNCLTASSLLLPAVIATRLAGKMGIPASIAASSAAIAFGVAAAILRPVCRHHGARPTRAPNLCKIAPASARQNLPE